MYAEKGGIEMKITKFHQEYFCQKCGAPLGDPVSAEYLQDEIYLYYICLKCQVHHCTYFTLSNFVAFPKQAANKCVRWTIATCAPEYHASLDEAGDRFCRMCGQPLSQ
jgi:hypothetical protein